MMNQTRFPKSYMVYAALIAAAVFLFLLLPRSGKFSYDYHKGSPWMYETLVAQFDFPILKTEEQIAAEKESLSSETIPYYRKSSSVLTSAKSAMNSANFGNLGGLRQPIISKLSAIYDKGVISIKDGTSTQGVIFVQKDKRAVKYPLSEVYTVDDARSEINATVKAYAPKIDSDSLCVAIGIYNVLLPDLSFDQKTTELVRANSADYVSLTEGVQAGGSVIVSKGEMVTAEIEQLLDSYKEEYERSLGYDGPLAVLLLGNALVALLLVCLLFFVIYFTNAAILEEPNRFLFLLTMFLLASVATLAVDKFAPKALYMVPFSLIAMYLLSFFKKRVVVPVYIISLLPLLIFAHDGAQLFVMFLSAGIINIFTFTYFNRGWLQFVNALFSFFALVIVWMIFQFLGGVSGLKEYSVILRLLLGSFFCVAGYPLIYLFEKIFRLVSKSRLQELCDTNSNKLLVELSQKAPGTMQHSLQVMNMCEAVAMSVDASVELIRAGAMYHDIGKMMNPKCFIENTSGENLYHSTRTPLESAKSIIRHVSDGLVLADQYGLPSILKGFINSHHGTSTTGYFYAEYLRQGGDPDAPEAAEFSYNGKKPVSKEQVILMLCDSVEAASRSLNDKSQENLTGLVDKILDGKISDGQLMDSEISMKELNIVRDVIKHYVLQIYHPRIAYPDAPTEVSKRKRRK